MAATLNAWSAAERLPEASRFRPGLGLAVRIEVLSLLSNGPDDEGSSSFSGTVISLLLESSSQPSSEESSALRVRLCVEAPPHLDLIDSIR